MIHLGNYEEFFVLYMDNELNEAQMKMVDAFLQTHPDLQAEFEILMGTRLPEENFSFDKSELFAESMKLNTVNEELLLYIDNELPAAKARVLELEMANNADFRAEHKGLLKAKLDAAEIIAYPNKKELYRHSERRTVFQPWMRIAAAVLVIAAMGIVYVSSNKDGATVAPVTAGTLPGKQSITTKQASGASTDPSAPADLPAMNAKAAAEENSLAGSKLPVPQDKPGTVQKKDIPQLMPQHDVADDLIAANDVVQQVPDERTRVQVEGIPTERVIDIAQAANVDALNNLVVTSSVTLTYHSIDEPTRPEGNEKKGSVKGFLRKASRMIEKRTGIDPVNDDGRLLIGAVALKLK